jgi:tetratricopeptide (TPR) repeat protein
MYKQWVLIGLLVLVSAALVAFFVRSFSGERVGEKGEDAPLVSNADLQFTVKEQELLARIDKEPGNARLYAVLGDLYFDAERFAQAIERYEKAVELDPGDADSLNDLGLAYFYTGNNAAALSALEQATSVDPALQRAWLSRGFILARLGRSGEAKDALQRTIELGPETGVGQEARRILARVP